MNNITHTYKLSYADYYPFGMKMPGKFGGGNYRYAYQGQEKDDETGFEAFELRQWDGRIGRWMTIDPKRQFASPYVGMGNNPVRKIDPDGGWAGNPGEFEFNTQTGRLTKVSPKGDEIGKHTIYINNNHGKTYAKHFWQTRPGNITAGQLLIVGSGDGVYSKLLNSQFTSVSGQAGLFSQYRDAKSFNFLGYVYDVTQSVTNDMGTWGQRVGTFTAPFDGGITYGAAGMIKTFSAGMSITKNFVHGNYTKGLLQAADAVFGYYSGKLLNSNSIDDLATQQIMGEFTGLPAQVAD